MVPVLEWVAGSPLEDGLGLEGVWRVAVGVGTGVAAGTGVAVASVVGVIVAVGDRMAADPGVLVGFGIFLAAHGCVSGGAKVDPVGGISLASGV